MGTATPATPAFRALVMAPNPWDGQWVNRQQLFSRIGLSQPVLYTMGGFFLWHRHSQEWQQARWMGAMSRADNVWVDHAPKLFTRVPRWKWLDRLCLQLQAQRWRRLLGRHGDAPLVAYVFHPMFEPYLEYLRPDHVVYHVYDLYDHMPGWNDELARAEQRLIARADLVVAASDAMADGLRRKGADKVQTLPNGANVEAFNAAADAPDSEPDDLRSIPHPRLGWVGSLHPEVDYAMIATLAQRESGWQFVLVGDPSPQANARAESDRAACRACPNVHFLGGRPIDEVPRYVANMDVNLMCYRLADDQWIKGIYPLKLHEYLAAGRPVISANIPSVQPFAEVVRIANGTDDWHAAITAALQGVGQGSSESRRAVASQNGWNGRVAILTQWLGRLLSGPTAAPGRQHAPR